MELEGLFEEFKKKKIVVIGDVMIDAYLSGSVNRISPEAPVPIVNFTKHENRLGGATNVALNLVSLGAQVSMVTLIGKDKGAKDLLDLCEKDGISTKGVVQSETRQTTVKTRVVGSHQQLLRIDQEQTDDINSEEEEELLVRVEKLLKEGQDAIIFQDYNKGVLTASLIPRIIALSKRYNVISTVDPKHKNFLAYKGVTLFKPNLKELGIGTQIQIDYVNHPTQFVVATEKLKDIIYPEILFVTLSEHGVYIEDIEGSHAIPAHKRNIHDVSGAGDTVISVATLCLCVNLKAKTVAEMANLAGGIVCEYPGVVAIDGEQLLKEAKKKSIGLV